MNFARSHLHWLRPRLTSAVVGSVLLFGGSILGEVAPLPPVVARYEQMLVRSPSKGTAFEKVYQHFFEGEGVEKLAARWESMAQAGGASAANYWLLRGLLADRQGRNDEAVGFFGKAAQLRPGDFHAWMALGDLQVGAGKFGPAIDAFQKALGAGAPSDARPKIYRQLARSQQRNFDMPGAIQTWQKFVAEAPDDPFVLEEAGEALADAERFTEARALFEKLRDRPDGDAYQHVRAIMKLAQLEEQQGHAAPARALYESALPLAADASWMHREVRGRIEELFRRQDDLPGLTSYYTAWLEKHPKDVEAALRLSDVLIELNKKKDAVQWLNRAAEWAPDRQEVQVTLAKRLGETGQPEEAVKIMTRLVQQRPEEQSYLELLGEAQWLIFEKTKDAAMKTAAMESWRKLAPATEKDPARVGRVGDLFRGHQLADPAIEEYRRAITLAPALNDLRERLAEYLFDLGRDAEAWVELDALGRVANPDFLRLAKILARHDASDAALAAVRKGLEQEPKNFDLLQLKWQMLTEEKHWPEALALFDPLSEAAPNAYFLENLEASYLMALDAAGQAEEFRKARESQLGAGSLSERDLRLLARQLLNATQLEILRNTLDEGRARFPTSFTLARIEVEYTRRAGDLDARVRALRRLIELQPKLKTDFLRDIANAYREESRWDEALAVVQELIAASPAKADGQVLGADILLAAGRFDDGVQKLREAVRLSDEPNALRLRLSRVLIDAGKLTPAREILDEAFEAAERPADRLALMPQLTEAYFLDSKLDTLIDRFRQRQRGEDEGWRYALYLAEIFKQTLDFGAARRELARALAARPRDSGLLRQMVRLSTDDRNYAEMARYQELLTDAEPSDSNQFALVEALLFNNQPQAAFAVLQRQFTAINKVPGSWDRLMPMLAKQGLLERLQDLIAAQPGSKNSLEVRLQLAAIQVARGDVPAARQSLWAIFDLPSPPALPEVPEKPTASSIGASTYQMTPFERRLNASYQTRQTVDRVLNPENYGSSYNTGSSMVPAKIDPVDFTRDTALLYLAALAVKEDHAPQFLTELDQRLATRGSTRKERFLAFSIVQAKDLILKEIREQVKTDSTDAETDVLCLNQLSMLVLNNRSEAEKITLNADEALALYHALDERVAKNTKYPREYAQQTELSFYTVLGKTEKAQELRRQFLEKVDISKPERLLAAISIAAQAGEAARVKTLCAALSEVARKNPSTSVVQQIAWLPSTIFYNNGEPSALKWETRVAILADVLAVWYPASVPRVGMGSFNSVRYWQGPTALPQNRYFDLRRMSTLAQLAVQFDSMAGSRMDGASREGLPMLLGLLEEQARTLPEAQRIYPRLIPICFDAWAGENEKALAALQPLLAEQPQDDDLRLLAATLLERLKKYREALDMLSQIPPRLGTANVDFQKLLLSSAKLAGDDETARKAAVRLASLRLTAQERESLAADLRALGLKERADLLAKQAATTHSTGGGGNANYQNYQELQRLVKEKKRDEALALARQVVAGDPLALVQSQFVVTQAMTTFQAFGQLEAFIAETETARTQTPDSLRLNYLLAVASQTREAPRGTVRTGSIVKLPCWLKLAREDRTFIASYSAEGTQWEEVGRISFDAPKEMPAGLVLVGREKDLQTSAQFSGVSLTSGEPAASNSTSGGAGLPAPWAAKDIGRLQKPGSSSFAADTFKLKAGGGWIGYEADALHFVERSMAGNGTLVAQVTAADSEKGFGEAGIMFRAADDPKSNTISLVVVPGQPVRFKYRMVDGSTEKAWRQVVALRPEEQKFQQQLAAWLKTNNRESEALAIYESVFAKNPEALMELAGEAGPLFKSAKRLDEWAAKVVAWQLPAKNNRDWSYSFDNVADLLEREKRPDLVEKVCRSGLEKATYGDGLTLTTRLAKALQALNRKDEVTDILAAFFLPRSQPKSSPGGVSLGFRSNVYFDPAPRWQQSVSISDEQIQVSGLSLLNVAKELEILPVLAARLNAEPKPDKALQAYVKLKMRDPAAIEELRTCLAENSRRSNTIDALLIEASREVKSWPGQERFALELERALRPRVEADSFLSYGRTSFLIELARTEEQLADAALPETLRALAATIVENNALRGTQNRQFRWRDAEICLTLLLRAGLEADYIAFLEKMKKTPEAANIAWNFDEERKVFRGENRSQAMVWLNDPLSGAPAASAEIAYEVRTEHPHDHGDVFVFLASRLRSIQALEKERTLRFLYGRSRDSMSPLGELTATTARGVWHGDVPEGAGWLKIAITENGVEIPSPAVAVFRSTNLVTNPAFEGLANRPGAAVQFDVPGWAKLPAGFWANRPGGPRGDGSVEFDSQEGGKELLLVGQRISLEKGRIYQQSGWLRAISTMNRSVDWGRRYLAADGKVLQTTYCPPWWGYNWRWHSQRLAFETLPETETIPPDAAFLEPVLKVNGGAEWSGLFIGGAEPAK